MPLEGEGAGGVSPPAQGPGSRDCSPVKIFEIADACALILVHFGSKKAERQLTWFSTVGKLSTICVINIVHIILMQK